jgi:4-amino-4-deoxy-L-arabinose transferase-like glycosyltransferase
MNRLWQHQTGLVCLFAALYFFNLDGTHLWDEDEAYFAAASRETCTTGEFIVPTFNGHISLHKPAFMYWIMRGGVTLFGDNEFGARCGSALFGIANVLLVYHLARLLFSSGTGWWSALIYGTALQIFVINRAAVADPELSFFCSLGVLIYVATTRWRRAPREDFRCSAWRELFLPSWTGWLLIYVSLAVAVLIKGPVGIVLPMAVIGLFLLLTQWQLFHADITSSHRHRAARVASFVAYVFSPLRIAATTWQMRPVLAVSVLLLIAGPWYTAVGISTDGEWLKGFLGVHNLGRFSSAMEGHQAGLWFFPLAIVVGMFPWCLFNAHVVSTWWRGLLTDVHGRMPFFLMTGWIAVWVTTFTIASTKLPHYIAPAYPALAILFGYFVNHWWNSAEQLSMAWLRAAWGSMVLVGLALIIGLPMVSAAVMPGIGSIGLIGLVPLIGGLCGWICEEKHKRRAAGAVLVVMSVSFGTLLLNWAAPQVDRFQSSPMISNWIHELRMPNRQQHVAIWGGFDASLVYYLGQPIQRIGAAEMPQFTDTADDQTFLIITDENYARLSERDREKWDVVRSTRRFLRDQTLLLARPSTLPESTELAEADGTVHR